MATSDAEDKDARFLPEIRRLQGQGFSHNKVWQTLHPRGLSRSKDAFRSWCLQLVNAKIIPPWPRRDNRGRPKGKLKCSLDLLDSIDDEGRKLAFDVLNLLTPFGGMANWPSTSFVTLLGDFGLGIPSLDNGEPDFAAYARKLGKRRLKTFGDMDYYLLARWTEELRDKTPTSIANARSLNVEILRRAREIRSQMAGEFKPRRQRRRKK